MTFDNRFSGYSNPQHGHGYGYDNSALPNHQGAPVDNNRGYAPHPHAQQNQQALKKSGGGAKNWLMNKLGLGNRNRQQQHHSYGWPQYTPQQPQTSYRFGPAMPTYPPAQPQHQYRPNPPQQQATYPRPVPQPPQQRPVPPPPRTQQTDFPDEQRILNFLVDGYYAAHGASMPQVDLDVLIPAFTYVAKEYARNPGQLFTDKINRSYRPAPEQQVNYRAAPIPVQQTGRSRSEDSYAPPSVRKTPSPSDFPPPPRAPQTKRETPLPPPPQRKPVNSSAAVTAARLAAEKSRISSLPPPPLPALNNLAPVPAASSKDYQSKPRETSRPLTPEALADLSQEMQPQTKRQESSDRIAEWRTSVTKETTPLPAAQDNTLLTRPYEIWRVPQPTNGGYMAPVSNRQAATLAPPVTPIVAASESYAPKSRYVTQTPSPVPATPDSVIHIDDDEVRSQASSASKRTSSSSARIMQRVEREEKEEKEQAAKAAAAAIEKAKVTVAPIEDDDDALSVGSDELGSIDLGAPDNDAASGKISVASKSAVKQQENIDYVTAAPIEDDGDALSVGSDELGSIDLGAPDNDAASGKISVTSKSAVELQDDIDDSSITDSDEDNESYSSEDITKHKKIIEDNFSTAKSVLSALHNKEGESALSADKLDELNAEFLIAYKDLSNYTIDVFPEVRDKANTLIQSRIDIAKEQAKPLLDVIAGLSTPEHTWSENIAAAMNTLESLAGALSELKTIDDEVEALDIVEGVTERQTNPNLTPFLNELTGAIVQPIFDRIDSALVITRKTGGPTAPPEADIAKAFGVIQQAMIDLKPYSQANFGNVDGKLATLLYKIMAEPVGEGGWDPVHKANMIVSNLSTDYSALSNDMLTKLKNHLAELDTKAKAAQDPANNPAHAEFKALVAALGAQAGLVYDGVSRISNQLNAIADQSTGEPEPTSVINAEYDVDSIHRLMAPVINKSGLTRDEKLAFHSSMLNLLHHDTVNDLRSTGEFLIHYEQLLALKNDSKSAGASTQENDLLQDYSEQVAEELAQTRDRQGALLNMLASLDHGTPNDIKYLTEALWHNLQRFEQLTGTRLIADGKLDKPEGYDQSDKNSKNAYLNSLDDLTKLPPDLTLSGRDNAEGQHVNLPGMLKTALSAYVKGDMSDQTPAIIAVRKARALDISKELQDLLPRPKKAA